MKTLIISLVGVLVLTGCTLGPGNQEVNTAFSDPVADPPPKMQPVDKLTVEETTTTMTEPTEQVADPSVASITQATFHTTKGDVTVKFYREDSPKTVDNFLALAKKGFYDGVKFHRVIRGFMIQGGDPNSISGSSATWGQGGPGYKFADEFNSHKLVAGSLAMANAGPDTNGSQFFIVTADSTPHLDGKHTNFGFVTEGMDVVTAIEGVAVDPRSNQPDEPISITSITLK